MQNIANNAKKEYNELLKRWHKYEAFCNNNEISMEEKLRWVPAAKELTNNMRILLNAIQSDGHEYTEKEGLSTGFEVQS